MKKYNLSNIMKRAWEIKRKNNENLFPLCLKMAWDEAKETKKTKGIIESKNPKRSSVILAVFELERKMEARFPDCNIVSKFNEWERPGHSRIYFKITRYSRGRKSKQLERIHLGYYDNYRDEYVIEKYDKNVFELI